jgi:carbon storage regulator
MLVLSRRTNETLVIDNNIRFTVLSVHGNQVRIGIEAPEEVIILREEIIHNGSRTATAHQTGADSVEGTPLAANREGPAQNAPYRRHDSSQEQGREHVKRRGVLGLRRRRP